MHPPRSPIPMLLILAVLLTIASAWGQESPSEATTTTVTQDSDEANRDAALARWYPGLPPKPSGPWTDTKPEDWRKRCQALLKLWHQETDPQKRAALTSALETCSNYLRVYDEEGMPELFDELMVGGPIERIEIKAPQSAQQVQLTPIHSFDLETTKTGSFVMRRITKKHFELWTARQGWLFGADGKLLKATPKQAKEAGREWFGAFLPDGQWVTTDLFGYDKTLYFFSRTGKRTRSIRTKDMDIKNRPEYGTGLIAWARSDKQGKGWVFCVEECDQSSEDWAYLWISPQGKLKNLGLFDPWRYCLAEDLGPRSFNCYNLQFPSEDQSRFLVHHQAGHGSQVPFPTFSCIRYDGKPTNTLDRIEAPENLIFEVTVHNGSHNFGFWPSTQIPYLSSGDADWWAEDKAWFLDEKGKFIGYARAKRLGVAADRKDMLYEFDSQRVATLSPDLKVNAVRRFVLADGTVPQIQLLFDDLRLGFFLSGTKLLLAKW